MEGGYCESRINKGLCAHAKLFCTCLKLDITRNRDFHGCHVTFSTVIDCKKLEL